MSMLRESLKYLSLVQASTKQVFKTICDRYDLVYFGVMSDRKDEHEMVRGFTLSKSHIDKNYCVGSVSGRDIILLERKSTISFPHKPSQAFSWTIMQFDLHSSSLPHLILNSTRYEEAVYANLFTKFSHLRPYDPSMFVHHDEKFTQKFTVYGSLQHVTDSMRLISIGTASVLAHHFPQLDYEIYDDVLVLYYPRKVSTPTEIEYMIKAGLWLAGEIDAA